jgi:hypothetical protein
MDNLVPRAFLCLCGLVFIFLAGCGSKPSSHNEDNSAAFDSIKAPVYSGYTAVAVTQTVKDFHQWLKVYNTDSDPQSRLSVYASPDDPNLITVFELTKSHNDAKNSFSSDMLKKEMAAAGVTSMPVYQFFDIKYRSSNQTGKAYRLGVSHKVINYDSWKKIFDEDEQIRADAGLELRAISTNADDPLMVNVMFATDDIAKAKDLINSDDLKKRMHKAGVRSEPVLTVLKVPEP